MSPQIRPLIVGLASPGLLWLATSVALGQEAPARQGPPSSAPASPATYRVLLLSSGKVVRGVIIDVPTAGAFCLKGSGGPVPYPKSMVKKAAQSVEELYQFQVERLPTDDPDEIKKLAKWCLTEHLIAQAKEQLEAVETLSPGDSEVQRMLYSLAASERPLVDPALRQSSMDVTRSDDPAPLDPSVIKNRKKYNGLPEIFDLPPVQAVKRFNEFAEHVQPVLQQNCVKCHNEKYQGGFQLVEAKIRRDRTSMDVLRANLDATLRLVNENDPSRSELLSAGLVPHGGNRNAIFKGPNDQAYKILVTWIKRVRPAESAGQKNPNNEGGKPSFNSADPTPGDGFAADRSGQSNSSSGFPLAPGASYPPLPNRAEGSGGTRAPIPQGGSKIYNYEESAEFVRSPGDNPQFPTPFAIGGAPANPPTPPKSRPKPSPNGAATPPTTPKPSSQTAKPIGPNAVVVGPVDTLRELPGMDQPLYPTPPTKEEAPKTDEPPPPPDATKKKPKKIDDALLERLMRARNGGTPATGSP
jgi:hypothetical protein